MSSELQTKSVDITIREGELETKVKVPQGSVLLNVLRKMGKGISAPCNGNGTCKKCKVHVDGKGMVLSCQTKVNSDISVTLAEKKNAQILHDRSVAHDTMHNNAGLHIVKEGDESWLAYKEFKIVRADAESAKARYGVAIDIGTTTVVVFLVDLQSYTVIDVMSFINPQTQFGHDVITRIQHTITTSEGLKELQDAIVHRINRELDLAYNRNSISRDSVYKMTIVGNPTMLHLLCRVDPSSIASAPYTPAFIEEKNLRAKELDININPEGVVVVLPSVSGYVGADITAGVATTPMLKTAETSLFIDIGTNGEMALSRGDELFCCATAAGPAFEGANIQCGVGGIEGAISYYGNGKYQTIGNKKAIGICGSGLIDITANLLKRNLIDMTGFMESDFLLEKAESTATNTDIVLSPQDIRQVQLAKAAIAAGIRVMMSEAGCTFDEIEYLYIGGAFGNYMNLDNAAVIGLIPPEIRNKVVATGNVAGKGSLSALMSIVFEERIIEIAKRANYIELSTHPGFIDQYVTAMGFEMTEAVPA